MAINDDIQDRFIFKQVDLERVKAGSRKKVAGILNKLNQKVLGRIAGADVKSDGTLKRGSLKELYKELGDLVDDTFLREIRRIVETDLKNVAKASRSHANNTLNATTGINVGKGATGNIIAQKDFNSLSIQGVRIFEGLERQADATSQRIIDTINRGVDEGLGIDEIVRSVRGTRANNYKDGVIEISKNSANRLIRTAVNEISNKSALESFRANSDVIKAVQQVSTLDSRTSDICKAYDGQTWDLETLEPLPPGNLPFRGGPPRHFNCRSILVPVTKSFEELGISTRKKNQVDEGTRKSIDGTVPESSTYEDWLRRQPESVQIEALGRSKWELWKKGKINFRQLVDQDGNALSTEALIDRHS